jgi:mono/diheme cytochrome c family protein
VGRAGLALLLGLATLACGEATESGSEPGAKATARAQVGGAGHVLYLTYCQGCHGIDGKGDGPAASALRAKPADLTQLWRSYGTPLDRERLARYIDGRQLLGAHEPRQMPIWGEEFFGDVPPTTPNLENAKHRLFQVLADYLETLQTERGA